MIRLLRRTLALVLLTVSMGLVRGESGPGSAGGDPWLVKVESGTDPRGLAADLGARYLGPLEGVAGYHRIGFDRQLESRPGQPDPREARMRQLESQPGIQKFEEDRLIERFPRAFTPPDPRFADQWHLENIGQSGGIPFSDVRARPVWDTGWTGAGTVIAIVDEGIEYTHPDLAANWFTGRGYDYNDEDSDPSPSGFDDRHGTAVAGIALAASNGIGGLGIAHQAQLVPLRLIAGPYRLGQEAEALSYRRQEVDIYNNSWGPSDEAGVRYANSSGVLQDALADNVRNGRQGRGNIYVWAAGNGGLNGDNSNYDGYNSLPWTISVGAVGHDDIKAGYSEPGANLLVVAPSGGRGKGILTPDNTGLSGYTAGDVYDNFSGTSAAAPMVAGVVSLLLQQRPDLGWRDVQQILALSASPVDYSPEKWARNGAGHLVSHDYGFGRVDAEAAMQLAAVWPLLAPVQQFSRTAFADLPLPLVENQAVSQVLVVGNPLRIQFVRIHLEIEQSDWGDLLIELVSPAGTRSVLAEPHANANSTPFDEVLDWKYLSTHYLNELSNGAWILRITDTGSPDTGRLLGWSLEFIGSSPGSVTNRPPVSGDLVIESTAFPVELDPLEGITDPDGDPLELISVQQPRSGELDPLEGGRFFYTMGDSPTGIETFSVLASDGKGAVNRRLIRVVDPRPVGRNDLYPVASGSTVELPVLSNDRDPDGDTLRLTGLGGGLRGQASILDDQRIRYTAPAGFTGVDRIEYRLTDDSDGESSGWATVIVQADAEVALEFDGVDDFVRVSNRPDLQTTDRFTAEAWIYPHSFGEYVTGFGRIFDRDSFVFFLNGFDHSFYNDRSLVAYFVLDNGQGVAANSPANTIQLDAWQHVAVSFDSTSAAQPVRFYVDGQPVGLSYPIEGTSPPRRPLSGNGLVDLYMGEASSGARAFKGRMTEFRIWNGARTPQAVLADHDRRLTGGEAGLQLYLPLDQTLEPEARNVASPGGSFEIFEAMRVPLELPWEELESRYRLIRDSGSGWWLERHLGWLYGDAFPWIYLPSLDWVYTGHGPGEAVYRFWSSSNNWGWLQTSPDLFPWYYRFADNQWLWYLEGTASPGWFYASGSEAWVPGDLNLSSN